MFATYAFRARSSARSAVGKEDSSGPAVARPPVSGYTTPIIWRVQCPQRAASTVEAAAVVGAGAASCGEAPSHWRRRVVGGWCGVAVRNAQPYEEMSLLTNTRTWVFSFKKNVSFSICHVPHIRSITLFLIWDLLFPRIRWSLRGPEPETRTQNPKPPRTPFRMVIQTRNQTRWIPKTRMVNRNPKSPTISNKKNNK
jgi:hypothetical protein